MKHPGHISHFPRLSWLAMAAVLTMTGCASEGPLRPPSLMLPAAVRRLSTERSGGAVDLAWTNPKVTTDGVSLTGKHGAGALLAELCRAETFATPTCTPITLVPVTADTATTFRDALPADLQTGPARALHYRVRVLNGEGKGAGFAEIVSVAGEAPPPIRGLQAEPIAGGVQVQWQPGGGPQDRTLLRVVRGPGIVGAKPAGAKPQTALLALEPTAKDPAGAIDAGGHAGEEQVYTVYRTRTARIGKDELTLKGEAATVTVSADAKAPLPEPPTGLEAISNTLGTPEIDLVWQASSEAGVAGYLVFRSQAGGPPVQLTATPVRGFSYADATARPGVSYRYSVAAVAADGRPGRTSAEVTASIQTQ